MPRLLTNVEARRIALAAQGFDSKHRSTTANWAALARTIDRIKLLQIDSVNVLVRSHYLPLFARHGHYDRNVLDARSLNRRKRHMFECWAHEASLVPLSLHPLMRWRMERARAGNGTYGSMDRFGIEERKFLDATLDHIARHGPTRASEVPGGGKAEGGWWGWSKGKMTLEVLFDQGRVTTAHRDGFERIYDLTERVIPADVLALDTPPEREAFRQLIELAAEALGIGTEFDLRDYFRLPVLETKTAIADAVAAGTLIPVKVDGWKHDTYVHRNARKPRSAGGIALLSPFDPIVWDRDRAERLFDFHYRIELYTPAAKRKFGYYVLPFLHGEKLAGRLCLKADRENSALLVNTAYHEPGTDPVTMAPALMAELQLMAGWLGLANVKIAKTGNLAGALRKLS